MQKRPFIEVIHPIDWYINMKTFDENTAKLLLKNIESKKATLIFGNGPGCGISSLGNSLNQYLAHIVKSPLSIPVLRIKKMKMLSKSKEWSEVKKVMKYRGKIMWEVGIDDFVQEPEKNLKCFLPYFDLIVVMRKISKFRFLDKILCKTTKGYRAIYSAL